MFVSCSKPSKSLNRSSKNTTRSARLPQSQSPFSTCANKFDFGRTMCTFPRQAACVWNTLVHAVLLSECQWGQDKLKMALICLCAPRRALTPSEPCPGGAGSGNATWEGADRFLPRRLHYRKPKCTYTEPPQEQSCSTRPRKKQTQFVPKQIKHSTWEEISRKGTMITMFLFKMQGSILI